MKNTFSLLTGIAVPLVLGAVQLQAEPYDFAGNVGNTVTLHVLPYASGEQDSRSDFVGLTQGYIDGDINDPFYMYCIDFSHDITVPTSYQVVIRSLNPANPANTPTFTDNLGKSLATLQQQATLGFDFGLTPHGDLQQDIDVQHDIWNLTGGDFTPPSANMTALNDAALASFSTNDYSNQFMLDIVTEAPGQAFMPVDVPAVTTRTVVGAPEPSSYGLMIIAMAGLAFAFRRKAIRAF